MLQRCSCFRLVALGLFLLLPFGAATAQDAPPVEDSFVYKQVDGRQLRIDWTRPADWQPTDRRGAVLLIHGGGWTGGSPGQFAEHSKQFATAGLVCFRVEYRLLTEKQQPPDQCIEDVTDAMRTLRRRAAEFGIDPQRIAAGGGSAGGHLAAYLGMMDDPAASALDAADASTADEASTIVDAVPTGDTVEEARAVSTSGSTPSRRPSALLLFNPVFDNGPSGWGHARLGDRYRQYSPIDNISPDDPPTIIFLGTADGLIPVTTGRRFRDALQQQGVQCELHLFEGQPHGFFNAGRDGGRWYRETMTKSHAFLESLDWFANLAE